ncbi:MAG TPA: hypothetical protein VGF19_08630, partial [Candidatus Acidoferrum sp.]
MSAKTAKPGWLTRLSVFELALAVLFRPNYPAFSRSLNSGSNPYAFSPTISGLLTLLTASSRRGVTGPLRTHNYITIARFSNSCIRTGRAQPAISTRP